MVGVHSLAAIAAISKDAAYESCEFFRNSVPFPSSPAAALLFRDFVHTGEKRIVLENMLTKPVLNKDFHLAWIRTAMLKKGRLLLNILLFLKKLSSTDKKPKPKKEGRWSSFYLYLKGTLSC